VSDQAIEVAVLGPVELHGAARSFRRSAALELIVYLAFHRHGVSHGECAVAIWPERPVSLSTLHATASDARRTLGHDASGAAYLPRGTKLRLRRLVGTDAERFAELAESDDPWRLRQALSLVRGPLFTGLRRIDWAVLDGTRNDLEASIVRAALRGAATFLGRGRGDLAEWMVRRALVVSPYDERLYRGLLRATAAQGNRARLARTMAQLLTFAGETFAGQEAGAGVPRRSQEADPPLLGCLHPRTAALYHELLRGEPATGGRAARL
jgi:DNA-binding SARP family transcriptional activator